MLAEVIVLVAAVLALAALVWAEGRRGAAAEQMEKELEDIHAANAARDRLERDADFAKRVRDRFTR